jgi:cyanophycinase
LNTAGGNDSIATDSPPPDDRPDAIAERIDQAGMKGTVILCGGGVVPDEARRRFASCVAAGKSVVILANAAADPGEASADQATEAARWMADLGVGATVSPEVVADNEARHQMIAGLIRVAGGVWICGGQPSPIGDIFAGTVVETELADLIARGGVVGGNSGGATACAAVMIAGGAEPRSAIGLDLLPDAIIAPHLTERDRIGPLSDAVQGHPARVGIGIDEETAVIIQGRSLEVAGNGTAMIVLAESRRAAAGETGELLRPMVRQPIPGESIADWIQLRRAARWRGSGIEPGEPTGEGRSVATGSLVIVGGGGLPQRIVDRFIELAGGESARIVVLPTAGSREDALRAGVPRFLARTKVAAVTVLPQSRTDEIASDAFREAVGRATGVWFDGGRQWNFVDAYENTAAVELFHDVLRRGGVIGGTSAGATIQGEYLVRGHPLGNQVMMAEGYERGFAFLPGVAIDQHFSQRGRHRDLVPVVDRHPKLLGIGIDEATAIVVTGSRAEVIGDHAAHFITAGSTNGSGESGPAESRPDNADNSSRDADDDGPGVDGSDAIESDVDGSVLSRYRSVEAGQAIDLQTLERVD